jgi:hypothetical protein
MISKEKKKEKLLIKRSLFKKLSLKAQKQRKVVTKSEKIRQRKLKKKLKVRCQ